MALGPTRDAQQCHIRRRCPSRQPYPYGVRGVGETSIVPPLAAISNAISRATNIRFSELPMSPPRVLKAIKNTLKGNG